VYQCENMLEVNNISAEIPSVLANELVTRLLQNESVRIERIVSRGQASKPGEWYDQEQDEWVILLQGAARLQFYSEPALKNLQAGDYLFIPAHCKHRVDWTHPSIESIWLAVHINKHTAVSV